MGLLVQVYQNIKLTEKEDFDFTAYVIDKSWNYKIKNLENGGHYCGDLVDSTISYPYSTHNRFREFLMRFIGKEDLLNQDGTINWSALPKEMDFYELIDFADNEGCLDFEVSKKLYRDFKKWESEAKTIRERNQFKSKYFEWLKVFELAKDNGVVVFI